MAELNLSHLSAEQLEALMKSISTIQSLTSNSSNIGNDSNELTQPQQSTPNCSNDFNSTSSSNKTIDKTITPILNNDATTSPKAERQEPITPLVVTKKHSNSFLSKRNITLPIMTKSTTEFKPNLESNADILSRINESLRLLQETYQEIGLSEDELIKSESYLMGRLSDLIQQADFTKQSLNLEIMTIMNNILEIDNILTKRFKYDYIIDDSIKETINKFNSRFQHSISNNEISTILLELNPTSTNLLELKEKLMKVFNQLHPRFTNKVIDFSNKTLKFYDYYNKIDDYNLKNSHILSRLPTAEEASIYNNEQVFDFEHVDHIINNSVYKEISHTLFTDIDDEMSQLKTELKKRIQNLIQMSQKIESLYNDLFIQDKNSRVLYLNELQAGDQIELDNLIDLVHHNIGLKMKNLEELQQLQTSLSNQKQEREAKLSDLRTHCQQLWFRLNQDTPYINNFLNENNNLKLESLQNFQVEMERLNDLKLKNIASFIEESRNKISQSWDFLMYPTEERHRQFPLFYDDEESDFTEEFLDKHNEYFDKLSLEIEELKPILNLINEFEELLAEKEQLEENCKDSSRLLQRNSFRILKEEEKTRSKLSKAIPQTIQSLKEALAEFEKLHNKPLLIEGRIYYDFLVETETQLNTKPSTKRRQQAQQQQKQRSLSVSNKSAPSTTIRRPASAPSPSFIQSKSVTRRPFTTIDETPVRRGLTTGTGSSLRLNKASVTQINDLNSKRKPITPTSQIISPLYSSPERKRALSPSRAVISQIDNNSSNEPPYKKVSGLRSPIRSIGIPLAQPSLNKANMLPSLKYGALNYNATTSVGVKSPIQLSSSDMSDIDDGEDVNKENKERNRYGHIV